jgi:hypothetical protein
MATATKIALKFLKIIHHHFNVIVKSRKKVAIMWLGEICCGLGLL